jgi:DNA-binding Xre family transcriptional regulator
MKKMQNNVLILLEQRARKHGERRPALRDAAKDMGVSYYTLNGIIQNTIKEYPVETLKKMCDYFGCNIGDILSYEEASE